MRSLSTIRVVLPARDEATLLPRCLASLRTAVAQVRLDRPDLTCSITVVLDSCTDTSAQLLANYPDVTALTCQLGAVGAVRALGIDHATAGDEPDHTWVANTDADCMVPPDWLAVQVQLAAAGYDLVVGSVRPEPTDHDPVELVRWWQDRPLTDGHPFVHGANLGVLLAGYRQIGGFAAVPLHEDVDLVAAVRAAGRPHLATTRTEVLTSGRQDGRAAGGFADYLTRLRNRLTEPPG